MSSYEAKSVVFSELFFGSSSSSEHGRSKKLEEVLINFFSLDTMEDANLSSSSSPKRFSTVNDVSNMASSVGFTHVEGR